MDVKTPARPRFVVIGNPENRRVQMFQAAVATMADLFGCAPECQVVAYENLLSGRQPLDSVLSPGSILRIDSPGENFAVERLLIARGAEAALDEGCHWISAGDVLQLCPDVGRISYPRQWYLGFRALMAEIAECLSACDGVQTMNDTDDIVTMFDKAVCRERLHKSDVPVAVALPEPRNFEQLREDMRQAGMSRVFVKLANSSSASGVVALQLGRQRMAATTSVELVSQSGELGLYNSLRLRTYQRETEIAAMIDWLCREKVVAERWMPKAIANDKAFDLRLLAFPSGLRHAVVRQSRSPITNLHLGNSRGDWEAVRSRLGDALPRLEATCRKISQSFPRTTCIAVDALIAPNFRDHAVIELNAFGDLLPGVLHAGQDAYQATIAEMFTAARIDCS